MSAAARAEAVYAVIDPPWAERLRAWGIWAAVVGVLVWFCIDLKLTPETMGKGFEKLARFLAASWPPNDGGDLMRILKALAETFAMAFAGTVLGAALAVPLGLVGAKTIVPNRLFHFLLRRLLDLFRGIPALVWALILVSAVGLGPFGGVIALALTDIPRLAKLFAEAIENVDDGQREAIRATGAGPLAAIRYGLMPQVLPVWLSQCLYFLESNFRSAAVLGIVGAGGIGFELDERIRIFAFDQVFFIIGLYIACVFVLDFLSERLRARLA
jgi:phosphonate transport system permease protein